MSVVHPTWKETIDHIRHDIRSYSKDPGRLRIRAIRNLYSHPAFYAVIFFRLGRWAWAGRSRWYFWLIYMIYRFLYPIIRWYSGVELQARTQIGPGLCILHFGPIIIHPDTVAGENLTILPGVTIGENRDGTPSLGDNITIGAGATIIGAVAIGHDVNIGAGAVVIQDLPDHCTAVGVPARPLAAIKPLNPGWVI